MKRRIALIGQLGGSLRHSSIVAAAVVASLAAVSLTSAQTPAPVKTDAPTAAATTIEQKLKTIVIKEIRFENTKIGDVVSFLCKKSKELDPERKGVYITLFSTPDEDKKAPTITIVVDNIPLGEAINYMAKAAGYNVVIEEESVCVGKGVTPRTSSTLAAALKKMDGIIIPLVKFEEVKLPTVIDYLQKKAKEIDPEKKGVPIKVDASEDAVKETTITMVVEDVKLKTALDFVAKASGTQYRVEGNGDVVFYAKK